MPSILVVITFLTRSTWGPIITMTPTINAESCESLKLEISKQIASAAKSNINGGASIITSGDDLTVVAGAQGAREMARLSCKQA